VSVDQHRTFLVFTVTDELRYHRLITIMREEGPIALYKGFIPKVLRLAPGGGVLLLVVEFTLEVFRKSSSPLLLSLRFVSRFSPCLFDSSRTSLRLSTLIGSERRVGSISVAHLLSTSVSLDTVKNLDGSDYLLHADVNVKCDTVLCVPCVSCLYEVEQAVKLGRATQADFSVCAVTAGRPWVDKG